MPVVLKRPLAATDLAEIWCFIADDSDVAADQFLDRLEEKLQLLSTQPHMGRLRPELMEELRSFPVSRYVVFYRALKDGIEVLRVLHSARDIDAEGFSSDRQAGSTD